MLWSCTGRSLAVLLLLAGRSHAAILLLGRYAEHRGLPRLSAASRSRLLLIRRTRSVARVRRREPRSGEVRAARATMPECHLPIWARPVSSGLVRFDDFEMQWNGNVACAVAVQRNGEAANWRVRPGRGRKRADTWCKARRTSGGSLTPGIVFGWSDSDRESIH